MQDLFVLGKYRPGLKLYLGGCIQHCIYECLWSTEVRLGYSPGISGP